MPEIEIWAQVRDFVERGGEALVVLAGVTFTMWLLILERYWFFRFVHPRTASEVQQHWDERADHGSWRAKQIRLLMITEVELELQRTVIDEMMDKTMRRDLWREGGRYTIDITRGRHWYTNSTFAEVTRGLWLIDPLVPLPDATGVPQWPPHPEGAVPIPTSSFSTSRSLGSTPGWTMTVSRWSFPI